MTRNNQKKLSIIVISICIIMLIAFYSKIAVCASSDPYENYDHDLLASYRKYNFQKTMPGFISQFVFAGKRVHLSPHDSTLAPYLEQRYSNLKTVQAISIEKKQNLISEKEFTMLMNNLIYPMEIAIIENNLEYLKYNSEQIMEQYRQSILYHGECFSNTLTRDIFNTINSIYNSQQKSYDALLEQLYIQNGFKYDREEFNENFEHCILINNQRIENYKNAADYLHENLFHNANHMYANTLIKVIVDTHKILLENLELDGDPVREITPGIYRNDNKPMFVFSAKINSQLRKTALYEISKLCHKYESKNAKNGKCDTKHVVLELATKEERENFLQYKVGLTDSPRTIEINMNKFAKDFLEKINSVNEGILSPIAFSAWTHMTLVQIHPFDEGNGRIARLIANEILMHWNYPPVIIKNDDEYTNAIFRDTVNSGEFAQYWANSIVWTAKQIDDPETGLLLSEDQTPNNEL